MKNLLLLLLITAFLCGCAHNDVESTTTTTTAASTSATSATTTTPQTTTTSSTTTQEITEPTVTTTQSLVPVDMVIEYEYTEDDSELQKFLAETFEEARAVTNIFDGNTCWEPLIDVRFETSYGNNTVQFGTPTDEFGFESYDDIVGDLKKYYTDEIFNTYYRRNIISGTGITGEIGEIQFVPDEEYLNEEGKLNNVPTYIELDGVLYGRIGEKGGGFVFDITTAKVISKTENEILFACIGRDEFETEYKVAVSGKLRFENGTWKYAWYDVTDANELLDIREVYGVDDESVKVVYPYEG